MRFWLMAACAAGIGAPVMLAQPALAEGAGPVRVLPMVKQLHPVVTPPAAGVPAACRRYAGAFAGQFANGPYANLIITSVTVGPEGCIFRGLYAWSAYPADPQPGTSEIGPTEYLSGAMSGTDLRLGNPNNVGMVVHPDLHAEFYMQGSLAARAVLAPLPAKRLE